MFPWKQAVKSCASTDSQIYSRFIYIYTCRSKSNMHVVHDIIMFLSNCFYLPFHNIIFFQFGPFTLVTESSIWSVIVNSNLKGLFLIAWVLLPNKSHYEGRALPEEVKISIISGSFNYFPTWTFSWVFSVDWSQKAILAQSLGALMVKQHHVPMGVQELSQMRQLVMHLLFHPLSDMKTRRGKPVRRVHAVTGRRSGDGERWPHMWLTSLWHVQRTTLKMELREV